MKKSILLTNYEMVNFAGSELDTIAIANYFASNDYEVSIFTLYCDYPLKGKMDTNNIKIITLDNIDEIKNNYDIIWAHHYPLLDYLIFYCNVSAKKIVHASLSSVLGIEAVPDYWKHLTLLLANSEATKKTVIDQGVKPDKVTVFPNYAPKKYFDENTKLNKTLKKDVCYFKSCSTRS